MQTTSTPTSKLLVTDLARTHWKLLVALAAGTILGAFAVRQGYEGFRIGGAEYVLIKKASIPKSLSIKGKWFYTTETSSSAIQYAKNSCIAIMGTADISQAEASNEVRIDAKRRVCTTPNNKDVDTNVGWSSYSAAVLPDSRKINVSLITRDPSPRIGYIEGVIPERISGDYPTEFEGNMHYLNTQKQTYNSATIIFCKDGTECARNIARKFKS
jgi:hypothetical protein